ncbi:MAG TPA: AAA family ATPase [Polyangiaceae bacterium]|nr:AAA family ATPase [Polyangiaceae bacterium]
MEPFLSVAIGLAEALGRVHEQGRLYEHVNPWNVLVDLETGRAWWTGLRDEAECSRDRHSSGAREAFFGALAYVSPEQTGRMDRSVDRRSDLYSYGVTLYEMLTGDLPFSASDPTELIHSHIAREPTNPIQRVPRTPAVLAEVVLKLLRKSPEERYQTAAGVAWDLRRCLARWEARGAIEWFSPGAHEASIRLAVPGRLYGREHEIETLVSAFHEIADGRPTFVLLSGYSGVGKSSLVDALQHTISSSPALFASGKFDQYKRDIPYATLAQALGALVRRVLVQSEDDLARFRTAVEQAVGAFGQLIANLVPELEVILGKHPPPPDLPAPEARNRFVAVLSRFVTSFASPGRPLVLFLDDLQWLDPATLDFLEDLAAGDAQHLFFIGAYRTNEVNPSHPLSAVLHKIRGKHVRLHEIALGPLPLDDLTGLLADTLHREPETLRPLAALLHAKTGGNPLFALRFIRALADERLLAFDGGAGGWRWDLSRIQAMGYIDNVVDLMVGELHRLPDSTCGALQELGCIGSGADAETLGAVLGLSQEAVHGALASAISTGLVVRADKTYRFTHDRVQEVAYACIPEDERAGHHLHIGRVLAARTPAESLDSMIFEIVSQLNRGGRLITAADERRRVAELNLAAGQRARGAAAFASALTYVRAGLALLDEQGWIRAPRLAFALELHRGECEYLTGHMEEAERHLADLALRATTLLDRAAVARARITLYTMAYRYHDATDVALTYLRAAGADLSAHPPRADVEREIAQMWSAIGGRSIEELVSLPRMEDADLRATVEVMAELQPAVSLYERNLVDLLVARMVNLGLRHGHWEGSCLTYIQIAMVLSARDLAGHATALRFGRLGGELLGRSARGRFVGRAWMTMGAYVGPFVGSLEQARESIRRAAAIALESGDMTFAVYAAMTMTGNRFVAGDALADVQGEIEAGIALAKKANYEAFGEAFIPRLLFVRMLRGQLASFGRLDDGAFDEKTAEDENVGRFDAYAYWVLKVMARFFAADHKAAVDAADRVAEMVRTLPDITLGLTYETVSYHLFAGLAHAARFDEVPPDERPHHLSELGRSYARVASWAEACPETFRPRADLLAAETARLEGRPADAGPAYESAMRDARASGFVHIEGIAAERAGLFYEGCGLAADGERCFQTAHAAFLRWGAIGKARHIEEAHPEIRDRGLPAPERETGGTPGDADAAAVVRICQSMSGEIVLAKLIERLMSIALEHAGATRGLLARMAVAGATLEAEATTTSEGIAVRLDDRQLTSTDLPDSVLWYVVRAREPLIIADAALPNPFCTDDCVLGRRPRSILCLPLLKQGAMTGFLYLENALAPNVFTAARLSVLTMLAPQAAISLENARLYAEVNRAGERWKRTIDTIPALAWSTTADGTARYFNKRWLDYTGLTEEEARASWRSTIHVDDEPGLIATWRDMIASGKPARLEARQRGVDGEYRWFLIRVQPLRDDHGEIVEWFGTSTDIENRKRAEAELEWRLQLSEVSASLASAPADGLQSSIEAALGRIGEFLGVDRIVVVRFPKDGPDVVPTHCWTRPGVPRPLEATSPLISPVVALLRRGEEFRIPSVAPFAEGDSVRALLRQTGVHAGIGIPLRIGGQVIAALSAVRWRDDRELAETTQQRVRGVGEVLANALARQQSGLELARAAGALQDAQRDLAHVTRLTTLGELAASIAHEVNQPLAAIVANAGAGKNWLSRAKPNLVAARETIAAIRLDGDRAAQVLARIHALLSRSAVKFVPCDLSAVVQAVLPLVRGQVAGDGVALEAILAPIVPCVLGDPVQLQQVVLNLVLNAAEASRDVAPARRHVVVRTSVEERGDEATVVVAVEDAGIGFDGTDADRLFETFYTTKPTGLGMGLSISRSIIERHAGRLWAEANPGHGATFRFAIAGLTGPVQAPSGEH